MTARPWTIGVLGAVVAALLSAPASAAEVQESPDDVIVYTDPELAGSETDAVEGTLTIVSVDRVDGGEYRYSVETDDGESVPVEVADELPTAAAGGTVVAEVVGAGTSSPQLAEARIEPAAEATTAGAHRAYVVRVTGTGTLPTAAQATQRLRDQALAEWQVESEGAITSFTVPEVKDLATTICGFSGTTTEDLWSRGERLFPTVDFSNPGNHLVMLVGTTRCGGEGPLGIGTLGTSIGSGGHTTLLWDTDYVDATAVHELGHNFGLDHANAPGLEYGDLFSVMGFGIARGLPPALDSAYRDWLGVTEAGEVATVTSGTETHTLQDRGDDSGLRGVRVTDPVTRRVYWVEYREGAGRDAGSAYHAFTIGTGAGQALAFAPGVVITETGPTFADDRQVTLVPRESGVTDRGSWTAGQTYTTTSDAVSVAVVDVAGGEATVAVTTRQPFTTTVPTISGTRRVGATLTAGAAAWTPEAAFSYQWYSGSTAIAGATRSTYVVAPTYRGKTLRVRVTGTRDGHARTSVYSAATTPIGYGVFAAPAPKVSGTAKVGRTLTASRGTWKPTPSSFRYQWYSGSTAIKGATKSTYKIASRYRGKKLRVRVTGIRSGYTSLNKISGYTRAVVR